VRETPKFFLPVRGLRFLVVGETRAYLIRIMHFERKFCNQQAIEFLAGGLDVNRRRISRSPLRGLGPSGSEYE
jgi:hypothetical protein